MRLFIATPLGTEIEQYLGRIIADLTESGSGVKWVHPENIHITLRFLGETEESRIPKITALIDRVAASHSPVQLGLSHLGAFPNLRRPRVFWAGVAGAIDDLAKIARQLELGARKLRFEPEKKKFRAHLTLGRVRDHRQLGDICRLCEEYQVEPKSLLLDRIVLFKSTLTPKGPIYERLHQVPLSDVGG
ncbi:RNA 2',3'-cyclic phosphodiesterase [candidate division GN15 bacterium]|nr:RNA 2',3'-cyclic phosphodiesterase [candidate division GN15 bacterium]